MGWLTRVAVAAGLVVVCLDAQARVADKCITTLGARPHPATSAPAETSTPRTGCPVVIGSVRPPVAPTFERGMSMPTRASRSVAAADRAKRSPDV